MIVDTVLVSLAAGKLRGGRFSGLASLRLRNVDLIVAALVLRFGSLMLSTRGVSFFEKAGPAIYIVSFLMILAALWRNRSHPEMLAVFAGVFLNFLVIAANGGHMPIPSAGIAAIGRSSEETELRSGRYFTHTLMTDETRLKPLADVLVLPRPYPRPRVFSVGDVLVAAGAFVLVQRAMMSHKPKVPGRIQKAGSP